LAFEQGWELFEFSNSKKLIRMRLKKPGIFTETEREREKQRMMGFSKVQPCTKCNFVMHISHKYFFLDNVVSEPFEKSKA